MRSRYYGKTILFVVLLFSYSHNLRCQQPKTLDAAELQLALKKLTVLGSVLYIAAHPDDENTALLAYLAKGRHIRAAYLSTTRGEGGQNLIGSEQGELMGVLRTQELLAARRVDGAQQFFTRAIDFGYSKTSEEALRIWNENEVLSDMVWIIRNFRPDIVITRFSLTLGGHGHHTASAILAGKAFAAAGDPSQFPEQLNDVVKPWKPKRLMFNLARFFGTPMDTVHSLNVDLGAFSPILGTSFTEIAGISRTMHKSQGFGVAQTRGPTVNYFQHTAGDSATHDLFDGINLKWSRVLGGETVGTILDDAYRSFTPNNPSAIVPLLMKAYAEMNKLNDPWIDVKRKELIDVIAACSGIWVDAIASDHSATPGSEIGVTVTALNRSTVPFNLERVSYTYQPHDSIVSMPLQDNIPTTINLKISIPSTAEPTQPYWLAEPSTIGLYHVSKRNLILLPENPHTLIVHFVLMTEQGKITLEAPVQYRWVDPVEGELYRLFEIVPDVAVNLDEKIYLFPSAKPKDISVKLRGGRPNIGGTARLVLPSGWTATPPTIPFSLMNKNDEQTVTFSVQPTDESPSGTFSVEAETESGKFSLGMTTIRYSHIPPQTVFPHAEGKLIRLNLKRKKQSIGYIMGSGDAVPTALRQVGYQVTLISDQDLSTRDLSPFDAIVAGVRAYNTRPQLKIYQQRLLDYAHAGGTYIVQYVTQQGKESEHLGPYSFTISRDRVSVEDAPVTFTDSTHPIVNVPNKITQEDFRGWVQERGLYFADTWDSSYQTILVCNDPGEPLRSGGLLVAQFGKGAYIYTGYSFFRQLPAGVPGAYRLFVNLIEYSGRRKTKN
ncbi:MAG: PIG-L family deacetylase [Ignavibacteria bacterium]|nr:PIG-L family deacetylase [Ignavibacteria bacterium]